MKLLSLIVPCYNEQENIADFIMKFLRMSLTLKAMKSSLNLYMSMMAQRMRR